MAKGGPELKDFEPDWQPHAIAPGDGEQGERRGRDLGEAGRESRSAIKEGEESFMHEPSLTVAARILIHPNLERLRQGRRRGQRETADAVTKKRRSGGPEVRDVLAIEVVGIPDKPHPGPPPPVRGMRLATCKGLIM
jgi:hypothetical protein